jgi:CHAT domain-containing protein/tetratricopeptide (TPR) repeat protein
LLALCLLASVPQWLIAAPADQGNDLLAQANALYEEAESLMDDQQWEDALARYSEALELFRQAEDQEGEARCLLAIGNVSVALSDEAGALEAYQASLALWQALDDAEMQMETLDRVVDLYYEQGNYEDAIATLEAALEIARAVENRPRQAEFLYDLGYFHHDLQQYDEALGYYQAALVIQEELGDTKAAGDTMISLGSAYVGLGQYRDARRVLEEALAVVLAEENPESRAILVQSLAIVYNALGRKNDALEMYQEYLTLVQQLGDREAESTALTNICLFYRDVGDYELALEHCEQALALQEELNDTQGRGYTLINIGIIHGEQGRGDEALAAYREAQAIFHEIGDVRGEGAALVNQGIMLDELGRYADAIEVYNQAIELYEGARNVAGQATAWNQAGLAYRAWGHYQEALEAHQQALLLLQQIRSVYEINATLNDIGSVYAALGQYAEALEAHQSALASQEQLGDSLGMAGTLGNISFVYRGTGRFIDALESYQEAVALYEELGDNRGRARTLTNMALINEEIARYEESLKLAQEALAIQRRIDDLNGEQNTLIAIASVYNSLGDQAQAVEYVEEAIEIAHRTGDRESEIGNLWNLGVIYINELKRYDEAAATYQEALAIARAMQSTKWETRLLSATGSAYVNAERYEEADQMLQEALALARAREDQLFEIEVLTTLGASAERQGRDAEALDYYQEALAQAEASGDAFIRAEMHNEIGAFYKRSERQEALSHYRLALDLVDGLSDRRSAATVLSNIAALYEAQGEIDLAIESYQAAIERLESIQGEIRVDELQSDFAGSYAAYYEALINLLWQAERGDEAFEYAERARARAFLNQIGNQQVDFRRGAGATLVEQEQALRQEIVGLQNALAAERAKPTGEQSQELIATLTAALEAARDDYSQLLIRLKLISPEYESLVNVDTLSLSAVQEQLLDEETLLVEYFVLEEYSLAWVIGHDSFEAVQIDLSRSDLVAQVQYLRNLITEQDFDFDVAADLYTALFAPLSPYIDGESLLVVAHDALHYLPFAALWNRESERYLGEEIALSYTPSASALKFIRAKQSDNLGLLLALGNPDGSLAEAGEEVRAVAELFGTAPLLGEAATESLIYSGTSDVDFLHLAAHGVYNPYNPLYTRIELAGDQQNDGYLEVHEIYGLNLRNTNLVVLSACETALGQQNDGDELIGLTRAFIYAGASGVISTLWTIDDRVSSLLMSSFYEHLESGMPSPEALRAAQQEILSQEEWNIPYYWAAFTLTGIP